MRIFLALTFALLLCVACHNTNPEQGSGGEKVDKQVTLSNDAIVDSTKALVDQSSELEKNRIDGVISIGDYKERKKSLTTNYNVLYKSLSPIDTLKVFEYRNKKEAEIKKDSTKNTKAPRWE
ncbi:MULTISPECIES: hypothetical protein [Pedobacter]|uniref:hypothetical protein n=1 Tax=Pedobacter TaxID=84567 RepID=UPI001E5209C0|nr:MULTISPECIES: hypothetical protein [Pedobacter]